MSSYTGNVEPGGPWQDRTDGPVAIRKLSVGDLDNNVYVIQCVASGRSVLVDAADNAPRLREAMADSTPVSVVQTHGHWDHVRAWGDLREDPGLDVWGHPDDRDLFPEDPQRRLVGDDVLEVGELRIRVIHTPGHTDGSIQLLVEGDERPHLFSGDSLFPGGLGNTWNDDERFERLFSEVTSKVFDPLPDETWVYPGHGADTTLGAERPNLPAWYERRW